MIDIAAACKTASQKMLEGDPDGASNILFGILNGPMCNTCKEVIQEAIDLCEFGNFAAAQLMLNAIR